MEFIITGIDQAVRILFSFEQGFLEIVGVSLRVSLTSLSIATFAGVPFGIFLARKKFWGSNALASLINASMAVPTVVIGLFVYGMLSRSGPLGDLGLLYTLAAMIIGQALLAFPIVAGLSMAAVNGMDRRVGLTLLSLGADGPQRMVMLVREARYGIAAAVTAGFARVFAEIGVSMMLGGNIKGYTRNITTAIALETSKGEFAIGIALGMVLLAIALGVNFVFIRFQRKLT